jgi:hypothetical protein
MLEKSDIELIRSYTDKIEEIIDRQSGISSSGHPEKAPPVESLLDPAIVKTLEKIAGVQNDSVQGNEKPLMDEKTSKKVDNGAVPGPEGNVEQETTDTSGARISTVTIMNAKVEFKVLSGVIVGKEAIADTYGSSIKGFGSVGTSIKRSVWFKGDDGKEYKIKLPSGSDCRVEHKVRVALLDDKPAAVINKTTEDYFELSGYSEPSLFESAILYITIAPVVSAVMALIISLFFIWWESAASTILLGSFWTILALSTGLTVSVYKQSKANHKFLSAEFAPQ